MLDSIKKKAIFYGYVTLVSFWFAAGQGIRPMFAGWGRDRAGKQVCNPALSDLFTKTHFAFLLCIGRVVLHSFCFWSCFEKVSEYGSSTYKQERDFEDAVGKLVLYPVWWNRRVCTDNYVLYKCGFCFAWSATSLHTEQFACGMHNFQRHMQHTVHTIFSAVCNQGLLFALAGAHSGRTSSWICAALLVAEICLWQGWALECFPKPVFRYWYCNHIIIHTGILVLVIIRVPVIIGTSTGTSTKIGKSTNNRYCGKSPDNWYCVESTNNRYFC